ncbi:MAG: hypothetical protein ACREU8_04680, partial [Gammaproteobacteria bacterium]
MSGVGKTHLANILRSSHWFHYSGDYRIGTRYLGEAILDNIKQQAMQIPFLQERGEVPISRMCVTCQHFRPGVYDDPDTPHHCAFVNAAFGG